MSTYTLNDVFLTAAGGTNGAAVTAWKASRFGVAPSKATQPPDGAPDAGPVTSAPAFGQDGGFTLACPTNEQYYITALWQGVHYWMGPVSPKWTDGDVGALQVSDLVIGTVEVIPIVRVAHTFAVAGTIAVPSGATNYLPPFYMPVISGQIANLTQVRYSIRGTGSVTAAITQNGTPVTGLTALSITSSPLTTVLGTPPAVADGDAFAVVVTGTSGSPDGMTVSLYFDVSA